MANNIIRGLILGAEKASQTLSDLPLQMYALKEKKKAYDTDYKIKGLQLEKLEREMDPVLYQQQKNLTQKRYKMQKLAIELAEDNLNAMMSQAKTQKQQSETALKGLQLGANMVVDLGATISGEGSPIRSMTSDEMKRQEDTQFYSALEQVSPDQANEAQVNALKQKFPKYTKEINEYLNINAEKPSAFEVEKEARMRINAMINENPDLQSKLFENPQELTNMIDAEVERLSKKYKLTETEKQETKDKLINEAKSEIPSTSRTDKEKLIQENMKAFPNKSRDEIINALKARNLL